MAGVRGEYMSKTFSELKTAVRFKSNIYNTTTLTDAQIGTELNQGYLELFRAIVDVEEDYFEEQKTLFNLGENSGFYSAPSDMVKFKQLRLAYSTPSTEDDYVVCASFDPSMTKNVGTDEINTPESNPIVDITNNYFKIRPIPDTAITNGGWIDYIARPSALTNSADTPIVPEDYHDLIAIYAASKVSEKFENFNVADRYEQKFNAGIEKMKRQLAVRETNRSFRFRDIRETQRANNLELPY